MLDHVSFGCSDLDAAVAIYEKLFAVLDYALSQRYNDTMVSFGKNGTQVFWLYPQKPGAALVGAGSHIAFTAATLDQVDNFHAVAVSEGLTVLRPAGRRPDIGESYYGTVIRDRDGNMIEAVAWT